MRNSRFIYLILALGIIPSVAQATDITKNSSIKIGGEVDSQFGIVNQQDAFRKNLGTGQYYNKNSLINYIHVYYIKILCIHLYFQIY
jgi:hypothetical protein